VHLVLSELTHLLPPRRDILAAACEMCIAFDDLCARARYAVEVNGFAPEIGGAPLAIRNGRHPLLVPSSPPFPLSVPERGDVTNSPSPEGRGGQGVRTDAAARGAVGEVVPFDLVLAPDEVTVLVSGPNTGGKTVLIKAVGRLCLMAQSGIIRPLGPQSVLPVFGAVFADVVGRPSVAVSLLSF